MASTHTINIFQERGGHQAEQTGVLGAQGVAIATPRSSMQLFDGLCLPQLKGCL